MQVFRSSSRDKYGVSPVIGNVMIIMIVVISMGIILSWGVPYIESNKLDANKKTAFSQLNIMEEAVVNLVREGYYSSIVNRIQTQDSSIIVNYSMQRLVVVYSLNDSYSFSVKDIENDTGGFHVTMFHYPVGKNLDDVYIDYITDDPLTPSSPEFESVAPIANCPSGFDVRYTGHIKGTIFINLSNTERQVFGRILVFDLGNIVYEITSSIGNHNYIVENGGIISSSGDSAFFMREPLFYKKSNVTSFRVVQTRSDFGTAGGGSSYVFSIKTELIYNNIVESLTPIYDLSFQFYGDNYDVWVNYLNSTHNFDKINEHVVSHPLNDQGVTLFLTAVESICKNDLY
jgi:FlaG/FlaF family flagellin (archaellin)